MNNRTYGELAVLEKPNQIFVFGSNVLGQHGGGTAKIAYNKYGAQYGVAKGIQGRSYAIPTIDLRKGKRSISLAVIRKSISDFYHYAEKHPDLEFLVAYADLGTPNLNGYSHREMALSFKNFLNIPENVLFSDSYIKLMNLTPISDYQLFSNALLDLKNQFDHILFEECQLAELFGKLEDLLKRIINKKRSKNV